MLTLEDVTLSYGAVQAVRGVSLQVPTGARVAMIGPNGAGKSSLLALLGGQARPSSGRIRLGDTDITHLKAFRRAHLGVARSFQIASLFPKLTVREQAEFALLAPNRHGWAARKARREARTDAERLLTDWSIPTAAWRELPGDLSYGQQRSLELALALASRPKVLLLDEPNVGLTAAENAALVQRIRTIGDETTVILVAHDMDVVFGVAERVIVMHHGQVVVDGEPQAVRADPVVAEIYFGGAEAS